MKKTIFHPFTIFVFWIALLLTLTYFVAKDIERKGGWRGIAIECGKDVKQIIEEINKKELSPGDTIFFRPNDNWR
jgi:hypothetical protein